MPAETSPEKDARPRRFFGPQIVAAIGLSISVLLVLVMRRGESQRTANEFDRRANIHAAAFKANLDRQVEGPAALEKLLQHSSAVDAATFRSWAADIVADRPEMQVIEWAPRVPALQRAAFERSVQQEIGVPFEISEWDGIGNRTPAGAREEYFPITYVEPASNNHGVLGVDVAVGQTRTESARARAARAATTSGLVQLAQIPQRGIVLIFPIFGAPPSAAGNAEADFRGYLRCVFRIDAMLQSASRDVPVLGLDTLIVDPAAAGSNRFIDFHPSAMRESPPPVATEQAMRAGLFHEISTSVGGREWLLLFRPAPEWLKTQRTWYPYLFGTAGLLFTGLLVVYVLSITQRAAVVQRIVTDRTARLADTNELLNREVAERRRAEEELRRSQSHLIQAQRIGQTGSWESDIVENTLRWSEETFRIFGHDPKTFQPTNENFFDSVHPDDLARVRATAREALAHSSTYEIEHRIVRPDGSERVVFEQAEIVRDQAGRALRMTGTVRDITERKRFEESLERERNTLRTIIDSLPDYIFIKDAGGGYVVANRATARMLGVDSPERLAGKTDADFLAADVAAVHAAGDREVITTGEALLNREEPILLGEAKQWLLTSKIPLRDRSGHVIGLVGISRDITDRKRAEDERQTIDRKVQETQKLESLGVLAGGIAHDFNNLLTGILGNASLARMDLSPESPLHVHLEQIELSSQRAADLCKQMLAYSGKGRFIVQRLDLSSLVQETTHLLQLSISKKADLKLHLAPELPPVIGDATQLRQIIMNLVMNASDAIGDHSGAITLRTFSRHADRKYVAELAGSADLAEGEYVVLEVSDTGCGMAPDVQARIFEPFFTTKFTGRGLGLAAVLGIVRGHKGAMKVQSTAGRGTVFTLLLPAAAVLPGESKAASRTQPWRGQGTILVADDEESVRFVTGRMLETLGFQVLTARDGRQAVQLYEANSDAIAGVLLDLTMPHMDGKEAFHEIRRINPEARVLLMSGFNEQEAAPRFVGTGLAGFIQKPFTPHQLAEKLQTFASALEGKA